MVSDPTYALQGAVTIPVFFHVVTGSDGAGAVTNAQIHQQIAVLNAAFVASGGAAFVFELSGVSRVQNQAWFEGFSYDAFGSQANEDMRSALHVDPARVLNMYTNPVHPSVNTGLLGSATFPFSYTYGTGADAVTLSSESSFWHGIMLDYRTLPGGSHPTRSAGDTGVHEVGHYLGLYHTFEGGCPHDLSLGAI